MIEIKNVRPVDSKELYSKGQGWLEVIYSGSGTEKEVVSKAVQKMMDEDPKGPGVRAIPNESCPNTRNEKILKGENGENLQQMDFECELISRDNK